MGGKTNILIVEDTEFWAQQIIKSLDPKRFSIKHVTNLSDAISAIKKNDLDAIVLDLQLPDSLFAKDTITAVMSVSHYTPVIACTAINDDKLISQAMTVGIQDFITKSEFTESLLVHAVLRAIQRLAARLAQDRSTMIEQILQNLRTTESKLRMSA